MNRVLQIGHNDIRLFLRDKVGYIWLFIVPLAFVYFMGLAFKDVRRTPANPRPRVLVENQDQGDLGEIFLMALEAEGLEQVGTNEVDQADRGIRIPGDFTEKIDAREEVEIEYFKVAGSHDQAAAMIELRVVRALVALNGALFEVASDRWMDGPLDRVPLKEILQADPVVPLEVEFAGRDPVPVGFNQSLPGNLVMFLMMNLLIFGGASLAGERENGVLRRLAVYPLRRWELVLGKIYGRSLLGGVQIVVFLLIGRVLFGVSPGSHPLLLVGTLLVYAWVAAALGVAIGAVTRSVDQTVGFCILTAMLMSALGGCWWPMEVVPDSVKTIGHLFPTAWAMDALHQLISFGGGWAQISTEFAVLAGFAIGTTAVAGKVLRY